MPRIYIAEGNGSVICRRRDTATDPPRYGTQRRLNTSRDGLTTSKAVRNRLAILLLCFTAASSPQLPGQAVDAQSSRLILADLHVVKGPLDDAFLACVGSERAGVILRPANLAQLKEIQRDIGFRYIRFHGIFHEDMHPVSLRDGKPEYDWTRIDALYDQLLSLHLRPIVELSFMPKDLASGSEQVFYWHGNITPPKNMKLWADLVEAFTRHLQSRYGEAEVANWYFEVWNEPNYKGFWPNSDQRKYFELYDATASAVKRVNPGFLVGGPATAGAGWIEDFLKHDAAGHIPVDFVSTHTYAVESGFLDADGKADLKLSTNPDSIEGDVRTVRSEIAKSAYPSLPLLMTEWSSSYSSRDPAHDSYTNAAFILEKLKHTEGLTRAMSYWTYTDLFEENGPPPAAFHGGFGLLTRDDIPKPSYFAYKYLRQLGSTELRTGDGQSWVTSTAKGVSALIWDYSPLHQEEGNKSFFRQLHPATTGRSIVFKLDHLSPGSYELTIHRTGYRANDAYSAYIDLGLPTDLTSLQIEQLKTATKDGAETREIVQVDASGQATIHSRIRSNDVLFVTLQKQ